MGHRAKSRGAAGGEGGLAAWHDLARRHETLWLAVALVLAAAVRVVRWNVTAVMFNDGPAFLALAEAIAAGDWSFALRHPFHPLYPGVVALLQPLVGDVDRAAVLASVLGGTAAVACLHVLVRGLLGPLHAVVASFLLAVHPAAIETSGDIQSDGLYLALFLGAAALFWRALRDHSRRAAFAGGILSGAAYLTRPEGLGLVVLAVALAGAQLLRGRLDRRLALGWAAAALAGAGLLAAPYLVYLRTEEGAWLSQKKSLAVVAGLEEAPSSGPDPLSAESLPPHVREALAASDETGGPGQDAEAQGAVQRFLGSLGSTLRTHFRALRYQMLLLLIAGWVLRPRRRPGPAGAYVITLVGGYMAVLLLLNWNVGYVSTRHALPPMVLTFGYAADGLIRLAQRLGTRGAGARASRAAVAAGAVLALMATLGLAKALRPDRVEDVPERRAAEWLRKQELPVEAVAVRKRRTAYYAGAPYIELPSSAYPYGLREIGASHLIVSDENLEEYPKLRPLQPPFARLLHRVEMEGGAASVYELGPFAVASGDRSAPASPSTGPPLP